jgi:HAD superfamily hydrolase (TIGR01549 family)
MAVAVFDLDDTLVDRAGAWRAWCAQFLDRHGFDAPHDHEWLVSIDDRGRADRTQVLAAIRERCQLDYVVEEEFLRYRDEFPRLVCCQPGTVEALGRLRDQGWRVAVVTNGPSTQTMKLEAAQLEDHVDAVVISGVEECSKPARRIFEVAAERCAATVDAIQWVVGDDPATDMLGAKTIGARSIWIRDGRVWPRHDFTPTRQVDSVSEAVRIILGS